MARIRKKHSPAFKAQVALEAAKQTKTIAELAKQFQVHPVQISQWKKQLLDGMETLFQNGSTARQPVKCAPRFGHENGGAYRTCTHALAEGFSRYSSANSSGVR